jgi:hypothetical protein
VGLAKVVPVHLINTDRKHPFIRLVDSFTDEAFINKFIDKEGSSVAVVKNQGMSEGFRLAVIGAIAFNDSEEPLIKIKSSQKIFEKLLFKVGQVSAARESLER